MRENFPEVDFIQSCHIVEPVVEVIPEVPAARIVAQEPVRHEAKKTGDEEVRSDTYTHQSMLGADWSNRTNFAITSMQL